MLGSSTVLLGGFQKQGQILVSRNNSPKPSTIHSFCYQPCASKMETTCRTFFCSLLTLESKAHGALSHWYCLSHLSTSSCKGGWKREFSGFYLGKKVLTVWETVKI